MAEIDHSKEQPDKLPIRVLIADDEKNLRELLRDSLETEVTAVTAVESGTRALQELEQNEYDILLLDLQMPGMDGISVLNHSHRERHGRDGGGGHEARCL